MAIKSKGKDSEKTKKINKKIEQKPPVVQEENIEEETEKTLEELAREERFDEYEEIKIGDKLTMRQELFCKLFVSEDLYGNGVQSYLKAYRGVTYDTAKVNASKLLTNTNICAKITELIDEAGLNDNFVDKQLLFLISQHSDLSAKARGINEYNKLRQRILEKKQVNFIHQISDEDNQKLDMLLGDGKNSSNEEDYEEE